MFYDADRDGVGLDLTPFVTAVNTGADAYAKIAAAEAAKRAARNTGQPAPVYNVAQPRKTNPMAYVLLGLAAVGGFLVLRRFMGKRRR